MTLNLCGTEFAPHNPICLPICALSATQTARKTQMDETLAPLLIRRPTTSMQRIIDAKLNTPRRRAVISELEETLSATRRTK